MLLIEKKGDESNHRKNSWTSERKPSNNKQRKPNFDTEVIMIEKTASGLGDPVGRGPYRPWRADPASASARGKEREKNRGEDDYYHHPRPPPKSIEHPKK